MSIRYNSNLAFVGPSPCESNHLGELRNLRIIQSCSINCSKKTNIIQGLGSPESIQKDDFGVTVEGSFEYFTSDGYNERAIGFIVNKDNEEQRSFASGLMPKNKDYESADNHFDSRNFFIASFKGEDDLNKISTEDIDGNLTVIGVGNCYVNSYDLSFSLGSPVTSSFSFSGETFKVSDYVHPTYQEEGVPTDGIKIPAVSRVDGSDVNSYIHLEDEIYSIPKAGFFDPEMESADEVIGVSSPRTMEVVITGSSEGGFSGVSTENTKNLQSLDLSLAVERYEQRSVKSIYTHDKPIVLPFKGEISLSMIMDDFEVGDSRGLEGSEFDFKITTKGRDFQNGGFSKKYLEIDIKKAELLSQSFSQSIGGRLIWNAKFFFEDGGGIKKSKYLVEDQSKGIYFKSFSETLDLGVIIAGGHSSDPLLNSENFWVSNQFKANIELD